MAGVKMVHIPYKGNAPALTDLVGGHVDLVFNGLTSAMPLIKAGKLRALAVTSLTRAGALPEMPTLDEAGTEGFPGGGVERTQRAGAHAEGGDRAGSMPTS